MPLQTDQLLKQLCLDETSVTGSSHHAANCKPGLGQMKVS